MQNTFQPDLQEPAGPGNYNAESSFDYTKARSPSPAISKTERQSPAREGVSPDQYNPNKETVLFQSPKYSQNGDQNEPQIHQHRPPASIGPAKSIPMIKNTLPTPPKPQVSLIFDVCWTSFG